MPHDLEGGSLAHLLEERRKGPELVTFDRGLADAGRKEGFTVLEEEA